MDVPMTPKPTIVTWNLDTLFPHSWQLRHMTGCSRSMLAPRLPYVVIRFLQRHEKIERSLAHRRASRRLVMMGNQ